MNFIVTIALGLGFSCWLGSGLAQVPSTAPTQFQKAPIAKPTLPANTGFVQLVGNLAPIVAVSSDLGPVDRNLPMDHMLLQLKRSPEMEEAVESAIRELQDPGSPRFHQWMTAETFGSRFGLSDSDLAMVTTWLSSNGFTVNSVNSARNVVDFSGTAEQVTNAFQTPMHYVRTSSGTHLTNMQLPSVPAYLSGLIEGVPLSDFKPHPLVRGGRSVKRNPATGKFAQVGTPSAGSTPNLTTTSNGETFELVTPGDFAVIYNLKPLWAAGYAGKGQTIAVVEDTLMNAPDIATFRKAFGLSGYAGTFIQGSPAGSHPCANPGINDDSVEAALDAEWAGATAPDANVYLAACSDTLTQFGGLLAVMNLVSQKTPPQTISMSYGECEADMGTIELKQFSSAFQQAVAEGVSVFVSSGDEGAASCDANQVYAVHGVATSGFATTPYAVAVGGTDFLDFIQGDTATYWSNTNSSTFVSALAYVPEKTWNDSCADSALLTYKNQTQAYGPAGYCNNYPGSNYVTTASGSGGPSRVYAKPSWQAVSGNPADSARDIPDVSLFAANGFYGHGLVFCDTQKKFYGVPCDFTVPANAIADTAGGTSFAAPALAGIFSIVTQKYGKQGNANVGFYALGNTQYGTASAPVSDTSCNSSLGSQGSSSCVFHDVTSGSIDLPCTGANDCYGSVLQVTPYSSYYLYGAMSLSTTNLEPTYPATTGWDFATGLGTINAENLVNHWQTAVTASRAFFPVLPVKTPVYPVSPVPCRVDCVDKPR